MRRDWAQLESREWNQLWLKLNYAEVQNARSKDSLTVTSTPLSERPPGLRLNFRSWIAKFLSSPRQHVSVHLYGILEAESLILLR